MAVLVLECCNGVGYRLVCVIIVAVLLDSCNNIKGKMFLQDVINNFQEGLILPEDGCLLRSEWRAYVIDRSGVKVQWP